MMNNKDNLDGIKSITNNCYTDVMVDLETLDTKPSAVVLSIGAVAFDLSYPSKEMREFYRGVSREDQMADGRTVSQDTIEWWDKQNEEIKKLAFAGETPLYEALGDLIVFIASLSDPANVRVWCKGLAMDIAILRSVAGRISLPWHYRNERDTRSYCMDRDFIHTPDFGKPTHHPVDDCKIQIKTVQESYAWGRDIMGNFEK